MTEAEWLACDDPASMLGFLSETGPSTPTHRKCRYFTIACCRFVVPRLNVGGIDAFEAAEQYADSSGDESDVRILRSRLDQLFRLDRGSVLPLLRLASDDNLSPPRLLDDCLASVRRYTAVPVSVLAPIVRDLFGNPFRPVSFSPDWRTSTALALARQMYDSRDFGAMPILADALQDAGCDNDDVLNHCRDANQAHVRGCFVVDLVLGKQ